jgi:hypothetical protein
MTKRRTVEAVSHGSGILKLLPFNNTMTEFMDLEHFAYVCVRGKGNYEYWIFRNDSMCDSVFESWEIRTTCTLWVTNSARTTSSGTLDGIPFNTSQGCMASGNG